MLSRIEGLTDLSMTTNGTMLSQFASELKSAGLKRINVSLDAIDKDEYKRITRGGDVLAAIKGIEKAAEVGLHPIKINCVIQSSEKEVNAREVARFANDLGCEIRFIRQMNLSAGEFGIVSGGSGGNCRLCSRIRLSSDGYIRPCLFNDMRFNIRELGVIGAISNAVCHKPERGLNANNQAMRSIGG